MIAFPLALIVLLAARLFTGFTRSPTMPTTTNTHDDTVPALPVDFDHDPDPDRTIGDLVSGEIVAVNPDPPVNVFLNYELAFQPDGGHALRILGDDGQHVDVTWQQAARIVTLLGVAGPNLETIRRDAGYQS